MITIEQCRAARGLLGWTQQDLAEASGLSKTAINNFEKGNSDIKLESLKSIRLAFESLDIEFLGQEGLKRRNDHAEILKGPSCYIDLLDDIITTLRSQGGELLILNANKTVSHENTLEGMNSLIERLKTDLGLGTRILYLQKSQIPLSAPHEQRISLNALANYLPISFIYGNKLSLQLGASPFITIINSPEQAQEQRHIFESLWQGAEDNTIQTAQRA